VSVEAVLDLLVPEPAQAFGDWDDVLARAGVRRRRNTRLPIVAAAAAVVLVVLSASPALGILTRLIGRIDVPFTGKPNAPTRIQRQFFDMSVAAPPGMGPQAIASQTRRVGVLGGHALYVAPTKGGGYCFEFERGIGGCSTARAPRPLSTTWSFSQRRGGPAEIRAVAGEVHSPRVRSLRLDYADGTTQELSFIWVSKPIDAGFFLQHLTTSHGSVKAIVALDAAGRVVDSDTSVVGPVRVPPHAGTPRQLPPPKPYPAPTAPLQQGSAPGITVVVGANGVAEFRTSNPKYVHASWGCLKFMRYHQVVPFELGTAPQTHRAGRIRLGGLPLPVDGCEVQEGYGHVWPDPHGYHSAVEIAFTARTRRFFADRAAARELALFVRWFRHHDHVPTTGITVSPHGAETTYSVRSTTGKAFHVTLRGRKVVAQDVEPYAGPL
jgi:hypothetical protein